MEGGALTGDPHHDQVLWMGGKYHEDGNYYMSVSRSTNGGSSWSRFHLVQANGTAFAIAVDPTDSDIVYAGGYPGLFKTSSGGASWEEVTGTIGDTIYALTIVPNNPSIVYAGTPSGVYKSTDDGSSWVNTGCSGVHALIIASPISDTIYAGTRSGVYKSSIENETWTAMNQGLGNNHVLSLTVDPGRYLYAGTRGKGVYQWSLTTGSEEGPVISRAHLACAYPNPSLEVSTISYSLEYPASVRLAIYDSRGGLVKLLVDEIQQPGHHLVQWDAVINDNV